MSSQPVLLFSILGYISEAASFFWLFTIASQTTGTLKVFKAPLIHLVVSDILIMINLNQVLNPDILFPLPAFFVRGWADGNELLSKLSFAGVYFFSSHCGCALIECAVIRLLILYNKKSWIDILFSYKGILFLVTLNLFVSLTSSYLIFNAMIDSETVRKNIIASGGHSYYNVYINDTTSTLCGFAPSSYQFTLYGYSILVFNIAFIAVITVLSCLSWRKLSSSAERVSKKTKKAYKSFGHMLLVQVLLMTFGLAIPLLFLYLGIVIGIDASLVYPFLVVFAISISVYPTCSVISSFYFIKPYRNYLLSFFYRSTKKIEVAT